MEGRYQIGMRVAVITLLTNALLAAGKAAGGVAFGSASLLADAVHSAADCLSTSIVLIGLHVSSRPADRDHPYGHGKAETLASALLSLTLMISAAWLAWRGGGKLLQPAPLPPHAAAMAVALVSIAIKEALYRHAHRAALQTGSELLDVDAWHHRADALSSLAVLAGVGAAQLGVPRADPLAAILVSVVVLRVAWTLLHSAVDTLMDTRPHEYAQETARIRSIAASASGIRRVDGVRMRKYGGQLVVDLQVSVRGTLPLQQAHRAAHDLESRIESALPSVCEVFVHINPTSD